MAAPDPFEDINADFVHFGATDGAASARQIVLVPGADVATLALDLPQGLRGQSREQVARRQLHDRIGMDPDSVEMRPFHHRRLAEKWSRVLVADTALIQHWCSHAGPSCRAVLPDYLALPTTAGLWTVASGPWGVAVRLGPDDGFGASHETVAALLECALRDAQTLPKAILRLGPEVPGIEDAFAAHDIPVLSDAAQVTAKGLDPPELLGHGELSLDLRRDPQVARAQLASQVLPWRWPVLLALAAATLWAASQIVVIDRIKAETAQIRGETMALVQDHFVKSGPVLDARIQVSQALSQRRAEAAGQADGVDPIALFHRAAGVIAAQGAETELASFSVVDNLTLVLRVADFGKADQLIAALADAGLRVEILDTRVSDSTTGVRSELRIAPVTEDAG